jgi:hypothetical protein
LFALGAGEEGGHAIMFGASIAGGLGVVIYSCCVRAIARLATARSR